MIPSSVRILVCTEPQDLRRSFDGLALATRQVVGEDPQSGVLVAFVNKRMNRLKILWWDHTGYCILYKRMHRAIIDLPRPDTGAAVARIDGAALADLLRGVQRGGKVRRAA